MKTCVQGAEIGWAKEKISIVANVKENMMTKPLKPKRKDLPERVENEPREFDYENGYNKCYSDWEAYIEGMDILIKSAILSEWDKYERDKPEMGSHEEAKRLASAIIEKLKDGE